MSRSVWFNCFQKIRIAKMTKKHAEIGFLMMINPEIENDGLHLPPDGLPRYRILTGKDDAKFCHRV